MKPKGVEFVFFSGQIPWSVSKDETFFLAANN